MTKLDIVKKFEDEFKILNLFNDNLQKAKEYYDNVLGKKKVFKVNQEEKQKIIVYYDILIDYNQKVEKFLGNQKYAALIKDTDDESLIEAVNIIKHSQIENGLLIEKYLRVIKSQPALFMKYFDGRIQKHGTYDRDINHQFQAASGYGPKDNYSISDFYRWVTCQKIIGSRLLEQLEDLEKQYHLTFAEINKGLYDSLFISHNRWKLITPNTYTFDPLDKSNVIKGSLVYECGTAIKEGYKTLDVPSNINTVVLHNPYNKKECETLSLVSDDMNVVLSFFGLVDDKDYQEKLELYNKYLAELSNNSNNDVIQLSKENNKQYVKTITCIKK